METKNGTSLGKQIWLKYFKWIVGVIILIIGALGIWIYNRGKKDTLAKVPISVPYPPDANTPVQTAANIKWVDTVAVLLIEELGVYLTTWHLTNFGLNSIIVNKLNPLKDWQLIYVANGYDANFYSKGKGSLVKDLLDVTYVGADGVRQDIVKRLQKLGAK